MAYPQYPMQPIYGQPMYGQQMMDGMGQMRSQQPMQQPTLLGRAVSNVEEARAVPSDLSGQPMFFPDLSHNAIHLKVFNPQTGGGDFYTFVLPQQASQASKPVRPAAARYAMAEDVDSLRDEVQQLRDMIGRMGKTEVGADD